MEPSGIKRKLTSILAADAALIFSSVPLLNHAVLLTAVPP
jgi:hypothetical protein